MFKIGDKVRLKDEQVLEKEFGINWRSHYPSFTRSMDKFFNKKLTIHKINSEGLIFVNESEYFGIIKNYMFDYKWFEEIVELPDELFSF